MRSITKICGTACIERLTVNCFFVKRLQKISGEFENVTLFADFWERQKSGNGLDRLEKSLFLCIITIKLKSLEEKFGCNDV